MTAVAESLRLNLTPAVRYVLRWADACLIHAQRLSEWCGHGPVIEEDIALTNMALDCIGQTRGLLTRVGQLEGQGFDEDQLAFLRDEASYFNLTLVELPARRSSAHAPGGDFADTVVRNLLLACWLEPAWAGMAGSADAEVAAVAGKALKDARYHRQHAADWTVRLGDGTPESRARMQAALERAWPYTNEMFVDDEVDRAGAEARLGPARASLRPAWLSHVEPVLAEATLQRPADTPLRSTGSNGVHSEHMGFILAEMQSLQRQFPGGRW